MSVKRKPNSISSDSKSQNILLVGDSRAETKSEFIRQRKTQKISKPNKNAVADISHKKSSGGNNWAKFVEILQHEKGNQPAKKPSNNNLVQRRNKLFGGKRGLSSKLPNNIKPDIDTNEVQFKTLIKNVGEINVSKPMQEKNVHATNNRSETSKPVLTKHIALDCEMVGVEIGVNKSMLARISLVNSHGDCIYDKFVKPTEPVLDYRTRFSGVRSKDLKNATDFKIVQNEVADLLKGRILVGHALKNDLKVLYLSHPRHSIRDTSKFKKFREGKTPSLKKLSKQYLGVTIQVGEHNSVQDALATMQLYNMFKKEWESSIFSQRNQVKKSEKNKPQQKTPEKSYEVV